MERGKASVEEDYKNGRIIDDYFYLTEDGDNLKINVVEKINGRTNPFKDCYIKYLCFDVNDSKKWEKTGSGSNNIVGKIHSGRFNYPKESNNIYYITTILTIPEIINKDTIKASIETIPFKITQDIIIAKRST